jgi:hypothetical protein
MRDGMHPLQEGLEPDSPDKRSTFAKINLKAAMNEDHEFVTAMLAIVSASVMLVAGQLYIENTSLQLRLPSAAQVASGEAGPP